MAARRGRILQEQIPTALRLTGEGGYKPEGNYGFELPGPDHGDFGPILSASFPAA